MGESFDQVPAVVQDHIKVISADFNMPETEESLETIAKAWLEKKKVFEEKIAGANMEEVDFLAKDDESGALALTYSGSLINIGPLGEEGRTIKYSSIGFRTEIPDNAERDNTNLAADLSVGAIAEFTRGPIKQTSKLFKIVVCKEELSVEEQEEIITEAATIIVDEFVEVNKTVITG